MCFRTFPRLSHAIFIGLGLISIASSTLSALAETVMLTSTNSVDAYVDSRLPDQNFGGSKSLNVGHADGSPACNFYSYLQFDLTGLPSEVSSAMLNLNRSGGAATLGTDVEVFVVTSSWSEGGITYNTKPVNEVSPCAATSIGANGAYYSFDITEVYNEWVAGTLSNFGLVFKSNPANGECFTFKSSENGATIQPYLTFAPALWTPEDFGDRVWLDWWAEDLADGVASQWTSRHGAVAATQGVPANQPVKQNGEVFFTTDQRLTFPGQSQAHIAHRAIMILFRVDLSGSGGGSIFSVNGVGGGWERQPLVAYDRGTNKVSIQWKTPHGYSELAFPVSENANQWHCLVSRRVGITHYASLDGKQVDGTTPGESQVGMSDWALPNGSSTGYIGDFRTTGPQMAIDTVMLLQDEMSLEEAQKLMGWGMWRRGIQNQLPANHPYHDAPPLRSPPAYTFTESSEAEWTALVGYWKNTALSEQYKGTTLNLAGWQLVFEDEFNTHTVTNEVQGKGNWFAPVHGAPCGAATAVIPPYNANDATVGTEGTPATYIQNGSTMTIRMQNSNGWKSGAFCSVNKNGYGRTWMYPYIEVRMKMGPSSTGSTKGAWPAVWLKSENYFFNLCESYLEYDIYEGYSSDNDGFHNSIHNWPAFRSLPGRLQSHRWNSNYLGLKTPGWSENVNLFDGQYHTYGVMVTPDYVINMFDGREMFRFPTPIEMKQPLWSLIDLAMVSSEAAQASGIYELTVDYIRVYQNPAFPN